MTIKKKDREYTVREFSKSWSVERSVGEATASYQVSKELAADAAALERYILAQEIF